MTNTFIDIVKLLDTPSTTNGPFYVVESPKGKHYVSSMGGRAAKGLRVGSELKLYKRANDVCSAYVLERA
jgi:hypothetical protein